MRTRSCSTSMLYPASPGSGPNDSHVMAAETTAMIVEGLGRAPEISFDVALINRAALDHLLGRGYRLQSFPMIFFSDAELGRLDRYVFFSPAFLA